MANKLKTVASAMVTALLLLGCAGGDYQADRDKAISEALEIAAISAQRSYEYMVAAARYQKLYKRRPGDLTALIGFARNLRYAGSGKEAINVIRIGIKEHGEDPRLILELGKSQLSISRISRAGKTLARARNMAPDNWEVYSTTAIYYDRSGRMAEAEEMYLRALKLSPGNPAVINNFSLSLAQAGKIDEGILLLGKLVDSVDSSIQARQNLALLYGLNGDMKRAEKLIKEDLPPALAAENITTLKSLTGKSVE